MDKATIEENLKKYRFYHIMDLGNGLRTPGYEQFVPAQQKVHKALRSIPVEGRRVLDIGCRDGLYSFEAEKMGAREVIGIDNDLSQAAVEFLIPYFESKVKMHELNVYDLSPEKFGKFDVIIFPGVLYHLRYPFWALKRIRDILADDGQLIIETGVIDAFNEHAMLHCPSEEESPYGVTSVTFFNVKGLTDTLQSLGITVRNVELFGKTPKPHSNMRELIIGRGLDLARIVKRTIVRSGSPEKAQIGPIYRATFVCDVSSGTIDRDTSTYWEGTHKFHSKDTQDRASTPTKLRTDN